ncbi:cation-transporting P-ATPase PacL domain protein [Mycobacterium kansasii]|uniref:Cation-transporting P-ATPase PacL domain protein n=1 Tax=Mycobacterium kansasii TaxID=1768 RepID=A0A1V3WZ43_MYCKA|nr:cation-transporting P-ATPase PacL domain protein [Mycobacterium kansasii]
MQRRASLTPSPVIATTWPLERTARAMRSLSSGETRAITTPSRSSKAAKCCSSSGRSAPDSTSEFGKRSPTWSAMAVAVAGWSPVTIATFTPARRQA